MNRIASLVTRFMMGVCATGTLLCSGCGPNSDSSKLRDLERLQSTLPVFPSLTETSDHRISKGTLASISKYYRSDAKYGDVKRFYVDELRERGWLFVGETEVKDWGRDFGGHNLAFRNNEYEFAVMYAGDKANYGWDYSTYIGWHQ